MLCRCKQVTTNDFTQILINNILIHIEIRFYNFYFIVDKIQDMKCKISKNDKKARKNLNIEITIMEDELERKQKNELQNLVCNLINILFLL